MNRREKEKMYFSLTAWILLTYLNTLEDQNNMKRLVWLQLLSQHNNSQKENFLTPKTDSLLDYFGKTSTEGYARKRKKLFTMNDHKFTKIKKTLYQRNSYIGHTQQTLNAFLCIFIFRTYYIYFGVRNFKSI